jgi:hypothetical protein
LWMVSWGSARARFVPCINPENEFASRYYDIPHSSRLPSIAALETELSFRRPHEQPINPV